MIKVNYTELDGPAGPTCRLEASGHAGYAPAGQDIVCAGASTLMQTLRDDDVLLVPPPFDSLYPHYLCAMTDAALGENDRYAGEQAQYNSILAELAGWLRRNCRPARGSRWRW